MQQQDNTYMHVYSIESFCLSAVLLSSFRVLSFMSRVFANGEMGFRQIVIYVLGFWKMESWVFGKWRVPDKQQ